MLLRHFKRVMRYARPSDYAHGAVAAAAGPGLLLTMERFAPSYVGKGGFAQAMRLGGFLGLAGGFIYFYQRSCCMLLFFSLVLATAFSAENAASGAFSLFFLGTSQQVVSCSTS